MPAVRSYEVTVILRKRVITAESPADAIKQVEGEIDSSPGGWEMVEVSAR